MFYAFCTLKNPETCQSGQLIKEIFFLHSTADPKMDLNSEVEWIS